MPTPKPNSSKPASPKPDYAVQARNIALDVSHRRRAGEVITDEQILRDHPNLVGPLQEQLTRLNRLETARLRVDHESAQGPGKAGVQQPVPLASDKLGTLQLPFNETPINEVANDNEVAINEAPTNAAPIDAAPIDEVSDANAAPDESAPTKLGDATDQLRITLKEQGGEVRNQSTMVLIEPLLAEAATADATDSSASAPHAASVDSSVPCYRPSVRAPMGLLKLFHDGQPTYNQYPIMVDRFRIGRVDGDLIVPHDFWMSGRHAEIQRRKRDGRYHWFLVDLNSTNGTFVQVDFAVLRHLDEIFIGQERYRFMLQNDRAGLMHVTTGAGEQWWLDGATAAIGKQVASGLQSFASDPYLDPIHAKLKREPDGTWTIRDNRSRNGVWFRVKEVEIPPNSQFQLGEQRFGFWTNADHPVRESHLHVASKSL